MSKTIALLALTGFVLAPAAAEATGLVFPAPSEEGGRPYVAASLQALAVTARLTEAGAEVDEIRRYDLSKRAGDTIWVTFYHSLSAANAAVPGLTIAGRPVSGVIHGPDAADALRQRLTTELRDPTALRGLGNPLFAGQPVEITVPANGAVEIRIESRAPLSERGTMRGVVVPLDWSRASVPTVEVEVHATSAAAPLRALYSPFHPLEVVREGAQAARATYSGKGVCTDLDLTLLFSSGEGLVHLDLLPFRRGDAEPGTVMALLTPDPTPVVTNVLPRDLAIALDTSGSMSGTKLMQAKQALAGVLAGLRPADSFSLLGFSGDVRPFQSAARLKATPDNVAAAVAFVDELTATGSTNIDGALRTGLGSLPAETGHPRYVVLLTDGQPTAGETRIETIAANAQTRNEVGARIVSFGIGNDVNTLLLDRLARESAGDVIYVRPNQSIPAAVQTFFQQISDPVLANPAIDLAAFGLTDLFPESLPDLFAGRSVILLGRYGSPGRAAVVLTGTRGGQPWSSRQDATLPEYEPASGYVPRIWALRQVGRLLAMIKEGDTNPALVEEVIRLASRYGVSTSYTTFAADPEGNVALRYGAVPTAQTGSAAVDASSALRDYGTSGSVPAAGNAGGSASMAPLVRYASDRTFVPRDGYLTDTKLADDPRDGFVDLTFGSEGYFAFASAEALRGAGALLAAGTNVRFDLDGRAFRVTDRDALSGGAVSPPPIAPPAPIADPLAEPPSPVDPPELSEDSPPWGLAPRTGCACDLTPGPARAEVLLPLAIAFLLAAARRARRGSLRRQSCANGRRCPSVRRISGGAP